MSNALREYNEHVRANLPLGITYDSDRARYVTGNGKYFTSYQKAKWYLDYIKKFGYIPTPANAIRDRAGNPIQTRAGDTILLRS